jgi:arylsulfatase
VYHAGISSIVEHLAPNLRNRSFQLAAALTVPAGGAPDGVIVGHGGHSGGYCLYVQGGRLHYVNNLLGAAHTTVSAEVALPPGEVLVRAVFTATGRFQGEVELWYGDVPVGRGSIPRTTPLTYGVDPFFVGEQRMTPVSPITAGLGLLPAGMLDHVVIDAIGAAYRDPDGEARLGMARQ